MQKNNQALTNFRLDQSHLGVQVENIDLVPLASDIPNNIDTNSVKVHPVCQSLIPGKIDTEFLRHRGRIIALEFADFTIYISY